MKENGIVILMVLALIGVGMAFAFVGLMMSGTHSSEDVWMDQKQVKEEKVKSIPTMTEEQQQKAIEIAKQNETVRQYLEQGYEIGGGNIAFGTISQNETEVASEFISLCRDNETIIINVDRNEGKVIGIHKSSGEFMGLERREGGEIKVINKTGLEITIGDRNGRRIKAPEVRALTGEEREKAKVVALSDPEVQNIIAGKNYELAIKSTGIIITNEAGDVETKFSGASVTFELEDGTVYFVHVDLDKEKVIRVSPLIYR
ncbi:MAG: hypothetical protein WAV32_03950 [Halobacteriota archaeon]